MGSSEMERRERETLQRYLHANERSCIVEAKASSSESVTDLISRRHASNSSMAHDFVSDVRSCCC